MTYSPASRHRAGLMMPRHAELVETNGIWAKTSTGSANAQTIYPEFTGYLTGNPRYDFIAGYTNTNALTISTDNGATFVSARKSDGSLMVGGEVVAGTMYSIRHDGTYWRLIGGASGSSFLAGATTKTSAYTVALTDNRSMLEVTGTWTLSLPSVATALAGFTLVVSNTGSGTVTADPNGSELINGALTLSIPAQRWAILVCDGTGWRAMMTASATAASTTTWSTTDKAASISLSVGNLTATGSGAAEQLGRASAASPAGSKRYWELLVSTLPSGTSCSFGVADASTSTGTFLGNTANSFGYSQAGTKSNNGVSGVTYGSSFAAGDVIGVALDLVSLKIYFSKNGVWQGGGDPVAGTGAAYTVSGSTTYYAAWSTNGAAGNASVILKVSATDLTYSPPSGYSLLP
ncbi:SPRY domain-containing protein [Azospirillum sp. TSA6c]|uniref:SPRY domain-containing protein n=1 Tax=Azospirillum sp. TSA6c TaxID=709813 RepID=UPI000D64D223|nr:SPRY domain-containing protein [Azospirillum sp. TSA6c]